MSFSARRPLPLVLTLLAFAMARAVAADRAPVPPPAETPPVVTLPTSDPSTARAPATAPAPDPAPDPTVTNAVPAITPPAGTTVTPPAGATGTPPVGEKATPAKAKPGDKKAAAKAVGPPPLLPRFQQVRDRIKALYGNRDEPRPSSDARQNPFRLPAPAPAAAAGTPTVPGATPAATAPPSPPVNPNVALLDKAKVLVKFTGWVEREGRLQLNLNGAFYKEDDTIRVTVDKQSVLLRITKLTRTTLTLKLGDAETTLRF